MGLGVAGSALVTGLVTAAAGAAVTALMPGPKAPAAPPPLTAPTPAPTMDQAAINKANAQQTALAAATSGRQSTVLQQTGGASDKLGG